MILITAFAYGGLDHLLGDRHLLFGALSANSVLLGFGLTTMGISLSGNPASYFLTNKDTRDFVQNDIIRQGPLEYELLYRSEGEDKCQGFNWNQKVGDRGATLTFVKEDNGMVNALFFPYNVQKIFPDWDYFDKFTFTTYSGDM